jgi:D-glycero-D-manno-heptose 1,7-bisphosphate phosphatase
VNDGGEFLANGVWFTITEQAARPSAARPGLILDRDGVLLKEVGYLHRPQDVQLLDGAAAFVREANDRQIPIAVITNQAGISREHFGWPEFLDTQQELTRQLDALGAIIDTVIACPFHPDHTPDWSTDHAYWRKPGIGMLELAAEHLNLNLPASWLVGDTASDIGAAISAGMAGAVHVETGHGREHRTKVQTFVQPGFNLLEMVDIAEARQIFERL